MHCLMSLCPEENMNVYIQGPVTRSVFNKSAITPHWVDLTFHHHLDLNQSPQGPRTIGGEKKKKHKLDSVRLFIYFRCTTERIIFLFFRTAFFSSIAYAIFLKVTPDRGRKGHAGILVESFFEVRGEEREREWKGGWWKDKNAAMKWRGKEKDCWCKCWSEVFFGELTIQLTTKLKVKLTQKWKICYNLHSHISHNRRTFE